MLEVLKFILKCVIQFVSMLFKIDVGFTNLGVVMCICYILFPMLLVIVNYLKSSVVEELDEKYDESRPRETWSSNEYQFLNLGNGRSFSTNHTRTRSRRYKI